MEIAGITGVLEAFLESDTDEHLWVVDAGVWVDGELDEFLGTFADNSADFLATALRTRNEEPDWHRWSSLRDPNEEVDESIGTAALLPLARYSRKAAEAVLAGIAAGWTGHPEALIPTLVRRAGLEIEDIGGVGSFTPQDRITTWYDRRTWHWCGPVEHVPGKLHFPVPMQSRPLAEGRLQAEDGGMKFLYASPAGGAAAELLPGVLEGFLTAEADCLLLQYDEADLAVPREAKVIHDKGYKWQLALKHLHPDSVEDYDFIFFWDDDLGVENFDPLRFLRIMRSNRLAMAQPAIQSPHGLSHAITRHRPVPPPLRAPGGEAAYPVVGRLTNFVEIMAPVFTREAWREFYSYLDPDNRSGWGYDYIPLGRKGIIDVMPVVHTRPVQSINGASEVDIRRFLDSQGLFRYAPVEMGWLFEHAETGESR